MSKNAGSTRNASSFAVSAPRTTVTMKGSVRVNASTSGTSAASVGPSGSGVTVFVNCSSGP